MSKYNWKCVLKRTRSCMCVCACVCLDWTLLICYRLSFALQSHLLTLLDTCSYLCSYICTLILSANRSTPFSRLPFHLSVQFESCRIDLTCRKDRCREEVINLFNASLIELTLAVSLPAAIIVEFLNSVFLQSIPMRFHQIGLLSLSLCPLSISLFLARADP